MYCCYHYNNSNNKKSRRIASNCQIRKYGENNNKWDKKSRFDYLRMINGYLTDKEKQNGNIFTKYINSNDKQTYLLKLPIIKYNKSDTFIIHPLYLNENGWTFFNNK